MTVLAYQLGEFIAGEVVDAVFGAEAAPDDTPFPFLPGAPCMPSRSALSRWAGSSSALPGAWTSPTNTIAVAQAFAVERLALAPGELADPEYVEAFWRLDALCELAVDGGYPPDQVEAIRADMARAFNAGIYQTPQGLACVADERPTRGEVRAWLATLATELGKRIGDEKIGAVAAAVAGALDTPAKPSHTAAIVVLALLAAGLVAWRFE